MVCIKCKKVFTNDVKSCPNCGCKLKNPKLTFVMLLLINLLILFINFITWPFIQATNNCVWKPIIYIYPKENINVKITASRPDLLTVTYPKYNNGWEVKALTDGTLIDKNNKKYYALYWEGIRGKNLVKEDGFIVKGEDSSKFLEEKLSILGLNYKEANEFIIYWLPKLEGNKYNYIRFQTMEEINDYMELSIDPKPDTLIRVVMEYKPLNNKIEVKEQKLEQVEREGYTIVEWGGTRVN